MPSPRTLPPALLERADLWLGGQSAAIATEPTGHAGLDRLLPGGGWPRGALSELLLPRAGVGELKLILPLLVRLTRAGRRVALVTPPHIPYAPALAAAGLDLALCWVAEPRTPADIVWTLEQLLRCPAVGAAVGWLDRADEAVQRRLQLAAETGDSLGLLLRPETARHQPSVAALRLALTPATGGARLEILKSRGGRVGQSLRLEAA